MKQTRIFPLILFLAIFSIFATQTLEPDAQTPTDLYTSTPTAMYIPTPTDMYTPNPTAMYTPTPTDMDTPNPTAMYTPTPTTIIYWPTMTPYPYPLPCPPNCPPIGENFDLFIPIVRNTVFYVQHNPYKKDGWLWYFSDIDDEGLPYSIIYAEIKMPSGQVVYIPRNYHWYDQGRYVVWVCNNSGLKTFLYGNFNYPPDDINPSEDITITLATNYSANSVSQCSNSIW